MTLTPLKNPGSRYIRIKYSRYKHDLDPESWPQSEGPQPEEDEYEGEYYERREEWYRSIRVRVAGCSLRPVVLQHTLIKTTAIGHRYASGGRPARYVVLWTWLMSLHSEVPGPRLAYSLASRRCSSGFSELIRAHLVPLTV
ncbi:hypothetical protein FPV67DRAFT_797307 [Lyophyllum atratum]|nr:hypothetical protein FPV67DRAFT_797307 [Lyophyllum atratum]